jgi:hypothetical protein
MTPSIMDLSVRLSKNDTQYKDTQHNGLKCDTQQNDI